MSDETRVYEELLAEMRKVNERYEASQQDGGRKAAAIDGQVEIAGKLTENDESKELKAIAEQRAALKAEMDEARELMAQRRESKAAAVGGVQPTLKAHGGSIFKSAPFGSAAALKAVLADPDNYQSGQLLDAIMNASGVGFDG